MIYTSDTIERIVTSPAARRALDYISPIYANAERFLTILNVIGTELDDIVGWTEELWLQLVPETATWSLRYWEQEYGLKSDPSMPIEKRRALISAKIATHMQMNPARLAKRVSAIAGVSARIAENTGKNRFAVYLAAPSSAHESAIRAAINSVKPAHLIYDLLYEMYAGVQLSIGCIVSSHHSYVIKQVI